MISKIRAGDQQASKLLYQRHESYWFAICLRYARNRSEAQDYFQEGVIKVFQVLDKFDVERGTFKSWSNRVLVNELLKYFNKQKWQQSFGDLEQAAYKAGEGETINDAISAKELTALIQKLPTGYRMVFNLYEIEGYSHKEIATQLQISVSTSKSQLSKAKRMLREQIKVLFQ